MQSEALLKEHEVRRRDLLILKYDKQRTLCDEIIQRQRALIEGTFSKLDYMLQITFLIFSLFLLFPLYFEYKS